MTFLFVMGNCISYSRLEHLAGEIQMLELLSNIDAAKSMRAQLVCSSPEMLTPVRSCCVVVNAPVSQPLQVCGHLQLRRQGTPVAWCAQL